ncbi:MAG: hypothetical protein ACLFQ9_09690 [Desulfobacterales bacterium]
MGYHIASGKYNRPFNGVFKLADIARPAIGVIRISRSIKSRNE